MKPRKSLAQKFREVTKCGTLQSFSRSEAIEFAQSKIKEDPEYLSKWIGDITDAYNRGLILCYFNRYPDADASVESVSQLTTGLDAFVGNVVYYMIS